MGLLGPSSGGTRGALRCGNRSSWENRVKDELPSLCIIAEAGFLKASVHGVNPQRTSCIPTTALVCVSQCWELGSGPQRILKLKETEEDASQAPVL